VAPGKPEASADFDARAATYDDLRPQDDNWWELFDLVSREADLGGQRVLDIGCGTGRLVAALAPKSSVWGIDASAEMLAVARNRVPGNVKLKLARAEDPPFKESWFDRVVYWLWRFLLRGGCSRPAGAPAWSRSIRSTSPTSG